MRRSRRISSLTAEMSLADAAKTAGLMAVCDPYGWFCLFLALGWLFRHSWKARDIELVAILCGGLFLIVVLILWRAKKSLENMDI